jgi:tripartite-type tricarboxylate transporter receptor subunit TctC
MTPNRIAQATLLVVGVSLSGALYAQGTAKTYPERPIKVILGYAAGGLPDTVGRLVQQKLSERWGQQIVTENRPGSGGIAAADMVAKAPADGYTLIVSDSSMLSINPYLYAKLPYAEKDFIAVSIVARASLFLAVNNTVPANTLQDLIALAKAKPGQLSYGSSGIGTVHHLGMEALKSALGLDIVHIPYKGTGQSVPAMVGGQVAMVYSAFPSLASFAKDGKVKLLAANSRLRSALAPDIPTVAEITKIADYDFAPTIGYLAPAGTPRDVIVKIAAAMAEVVKMPDIVQRFAGLGIESVGSTPEEQTAQWRSDAERFSKVVKAVGAKAE